MAWNDDDIAQRVARDIEPTWAINLGVGLPTLIAGHLSAPGLMVHSENGILGMGPRPAPGEEDPDLIDAGKNPTTVVPGAAFMDSLMSFGLIRGGHLDLSVMGAYQVSSGGDLANWKLPGRRVAALGGAADLATGARRVWIAMRHTTKDGKPKIVDRCTYPVTARGVVSRIYTDLAVLERDQGGFSVVELAPGVTHDDLQAATEAPLAVPA